MGSLKEGGKRKDRKGENSHWWVIAKQSRAMVTPSKKVSGHIREEKTPPASGSVVSSRLLRRLGKRKGAQSYRSLQPTRLRLQKQPNLSPTKQCWSCVQVMQLGQQLQRRVGRWRSASAPESNARVVSRLCKGRWVAKVERDFDFPESFPPLPSFLKCWRWGGGAGAGGR